MGILELMRERRIYFDGGMGSLLQARGLKPGELPETWNLSRPEIITEIHREYLDAGSDVVTTNTFGANHFKFKAEDGYSVKEIVTAAVRNAKNAIAAAGHGYAALDMGPTGKLLKPYGDLEFEDAYAGKSVHLFIIMKQQVYFSVNKPHLFFIFPKSSRPAWYLTFLFSYQGILI